MIPWWSTFSETFYIPTQLGYCLGVSLEKVFLVARRLYALGWQVSMHKSDRILWIYCRWGREKDWLS